MNDVRVNQFFTKEIRVFQPALNLTRVIQVPGTNNADVWLKSIAYLSYLSRMVNNCMNFSG